MFLLLRIDVAIRTSIDAVYERVMMQLEEVRGSVHDVRGGIDRDRQLLYHLGDEVRTLDSLSQELVATLDAVDRRLTAGLRDARRDLDGVIGDVRSLIAKLNTVPYLSGSLLETFETPVGLSEGFRELPVAGGGEAAYAAFEDIFRGPADRVEELQRPYLPLVADRAPVLDVGCGRGEFLVLLAEHGIAARGVDADAGMVERCLAQGLDVTHGDAARYLEDLEDGSLGTVFCAQVIEHLSAGEFRRLLDLARAKLRPGGLFIGETINPHSIPAMKTFWVDLTHHQPVFPEVALAQCAIAGFAPAYVFAPGFDSFPAVRFEANTYAVVAEVPR